MDAEGEYTFRNTNLPQHSFNYFAVLRDKKKLCDIEFTAGNQRISALRVILIAAIPLFRETLFEKEEIPVPDIDRNVFECLIDYSYSCELKITMVNVKGLLAGACVLLMKDVQDVCCDFLSQRLNPENVLNFRNFAVDLNITQLKEITDLYVKENFEEISQTEGFLHSPLTYVRELIAKDDLNVISEEKVLESVLRWVKASLTERKDNLTELLKQVRMVLLKPFYLKNLLETEELMRTSFPVRDLIDEAIDCNLIPERRKAVCSFSTEPRQFMKICEVSAETGFTMYSLNAVVKYNVLQLDRSKKAWSPKLTEVYFVNNGCVAVLNGKMYFFNGCDTFEYDRENNKCRLLRSMETPKLFAAATSLSGTIFVCGGYVGDFMASSVVECFDPGPNKFTKVNPMLTARFSLNAVSLGDYIYVIGGRDKQRVFDKVERYNDNTDKWQYMSSLLTPRYSSGAAVLNGKIYVCGGITSNTVYEPTTTAEIYDPLINRWQLISPMKVARYGLKLGPFCGKLHGIGGRTSFFEPQYSCEIYDPETDKWTYGPSVDRRSCAVVVM